MQSEKRILLLTPAESAQGGIINYFQTLKSRFSLPVDYFERGARTWPVRKGKIAEIVRALQDLRAFKRRLNSGNYALVQTSTSLGSLAVVRDGFFLRAAKKRNVKVVVFFRGWDEGFEHTLERHFLPLFKRIFFQADAMIVLASAFKIKLQAWGYSRQIYIETTIVDETLLTGVDSKSVAQKYDDRSGKINLLFLARIVKAKGVYETLDAFALLLLKYPQLQLTVTGDGFELQSAKQYVQDKAIVNVIFTGKVIGEEKGQLYKTAHIYIFPSYTEGLPNSVLEAMAFGLPVVATPVGGLVDILRDGETGYFVKKRDGHDIVGKIEILLSNSSLMKRIAIINYNYAADRFYATQVLNRLEKIYTQFIN